MGVEPLTWESDWLRSNLSLRSYQLSLTLGQPGPCQLSSHKTYLREKVGKVSAFFSVDNLIMRKRNLLGLFPLALGFRFTHPTALAKMHEVMSKNCSDSKVTLPFKKFNKKMVSLSVLQKDDFLSFLVCWPYSSWMGTESYQMLFGINGKDHGNFLL